MKNETQSNVVTAEFDNGKFVVSYDPEKLVQELVEAGLAGGLASLALTTAAHRRSDEKRPETGATHEQVKEWLVSLCSGASSGSRFRLSKEDKDRAAKVLAAYKQAPEQVAEQFKAKFGKGMPVTEDALARHFMEERAKSAQALF